MNHTRSAGGIILNRDGRVAVVSQGGVSWSLPKGHIEEGEDALAAARREIYEETGLRSVELVRDLGSYQRFRLGADGREDPVELKTIHMFLFTTAEAELTPQDANNPEARWVEKDEVADLLTHEKDREFFLSFLRTAGG
ncbi:MAG TPA: NUDIX domain-containing protein [Pyrinomonadaceae bacterium]|jgi:8-oxo-dGTP pyrophosphatase MutT (NUDIX family)|nr:NUDIX domain-containing protein [Pyrinomonadaceae bacterium]